MCRINPNGVNMYFQDGSMFYQRGKMFFREGSKRFISFRESRLVPQETRQMVYEDDKFDRKQWSIYRLVMYGLGTLSREDRQQMSLNQLRRARTRYIKAQVELNRMKNEFLDAQLQLCLGQKHDNAHFNQNCREEYDSVRNCLPFSFFRITDEMIIERLISVGVLRVKDFPMFLSPEPILDSPLALAKLPKEYIEAPQH